jgi:hypothetical protein
MAAPTSVTYHEPNHVIEVAGTDVDAGNHDYVLDYNQANLGKGFSIVTGTLTAMDVKVFGYNSTAASAVDITDDLWESVTSLASNTAYVANIPISLKGIIVRCARSNATNAVSLTIFAPKR